MTTHHHLTHDAGAPGITLRLTEELRQRGHHVTMLSLDDIPERIATRARNKVFPWYVACRMWGAGAAFDVVDASTADTYVWAGLFPQWRAPALVVRSHGLEHLHHDRRLAEARRGHVKLSWRYPIYHGGWRLKEVAMSLRQADHVIMLNQTEADYAIRQLRVSRKRISIIPHAVSDHLLDTSFPSSNSATASAGLQIAVIGRYEAMKGRAYLAPALNRILRILPDARVAFLGTGIEDTHVLRDYHGISPDRVTTIRGYKNDHLGTLLRGFHVLLSASLSDGFGLGILEAMACGLAPVVSTTCGVSECISDWSNGVLIPPADADAIVATILELAADRARLENIRRSAKASAQQYTWRSVLTQTVRAYRSAIQMRKAL